MPSPSWCVHRSAFVAGGPCQLTALFHLQLFTHKAKSVDFKLNPCKQLEDGSWEFVETFDDPETTGAFMLALHCTEERLDSRHVSASLSHL